MYTILVNPILGAYSATHNMYENQGLFILNFNVIRAEHCFCDLMAIGVHGSNTWSVHFFACLTGLVMGKNLP